MENWARVQLRVHYMLEYYEKYPKFDLQSWNKVQNHIVSEFGDLNASFWTLTLLDGTKCIYFIQASWW